VTSVVHDFQTSLSKSLSLNDEGYWIKFYLSIWPEMLSCVRLDANSKWQKWGVDRMILLPGGRQVFIDEKMRFPNPKTGVSYDDFLCEEWSVFQNRVGVKVGWTLDREKRCDFIAYAIPGIGRCYLLPFELLRITSELFFPSWKDVPRAYPKNAFNGEYVTRSCAVSWDLLFDSMRKIMTRNFGGFPLQIPPPTLNGDKAHFQWTIPRKL